jgi:predicted GNAT family acetyltransferase
MAEATIVDNAVLHRFELQQNGETAFLLYSKTGGSIRLIHTEVPEALRGQGVGSKLVGGVLRQAQQRELSIIPSCPFVAEYLRGHPDLASLVEAQHRWMIEPVK